MRSVFDRPWLQANLMAGSMPTRNTFDYVILLRQCILVTTSYIDKNLKMVQATAWCRIKFLSLFITCLVLLLFPDLSKVTRLLLLTCIACFMREWLVSTDIDFCFVVIWLCVAIKAPSDVYAPSTLTLRHGMTFVDPECPICDTDDCNFFFYFLHADFTNSALLEVEIFKSSMIKGLSSYYSFFIFLRVSAPGAPKFNLMTVSFRLGEKRVGFLTC